MLGLLEEGGAGWEVGLRVRLLLVVGFGGGVGGAYSLGVVHFCGWARIMRGWSFGVVVLFVLS